jgi:hypothetical protein
MIPQIESAKGFGALPEVKDQGIFAGVGDGSAGSKPVVDELKLLRAELRLGGSGSATVASVGTPPDFSRLTASLNTLGSDLQAKFTSSTEATNQLATTFTGTSRTTGTLDTANLETSINTLAATLTPTGAGPGEELLTGTEGANLTTGGGAVEGTLGIDFGTPEVLVTFGNRLEVSSSSDPEKREAEIRTMIESMITEMLPTEMLGKLTPRPPSSEEGTNPAQNV